ncbi:uncharacterized protein HaLaN_00440, partial [Haematococcus lacustris]
LAGEEDLVPGLGPVSLAGGPFMAEPRTRDRKELYKVFVEHHLEQAGRFTPQLQADTKDLQVVSGRLDSAPSPADLLGGLCDRLHFSPEAAMELHKSLYRTKLEALLESKPRLSGADQEELRRIQRILCLPPAAVKAAQKETLGKQLEEAISDIFMMGAKPVSEGDLDQLEELIKGLRLEPDVAMEIFKTSVRDRLKSYVGQALKERGANQDRKAAAAVLKKLVQFNAIVVTPMLERVKGLDAVAKEVAELMTKAMAEAKAKGEDLPESVAAKMAAEEAEASTGTSGAQDNVKTVQKAMQSARGQFGEEERKGQREINLRDDVSHENRALLYRDYMMTTMQGEAVQLPVGGTLRRKVSSDARNADMARLHALSEVLGMDQGEVAAVHAELSETAYKAQAAEVLRSGPLTADKKEYLEGLRSQLGLTRQQADKAMASARTEMSGSAAVAEEGGKWTLERVLELAKSGGDVIDTVEEATRRALFRREFEKRVSDGTGDFDAQFVLKELPALLGLEDKRVMSVVKELVGTRRRLLLVQ